MRRTETKSKPTNIIGVRRYTCMNQFGCCRFSPMCIRWRRDGRLRTTCTHSRICHSQPLSHVSLNFYTLYRLNFVFVYIGWVTHTSTWQCVDAKFTEWVDGANDTFGIMANFLFVLRPNCSWIQRGAVIAPNSSKHLCSHRWHYVLEFLQRYWHSYMYIRILHSASMNIICMESTSVLFVMPLIY